MKRRESQQIIERNEPLLEQIERTKAEHPFWGYRRVWAYLKYAREFEVNKKRVLRLMQKHNLLVKPNMALKACRTPQRSKPKPDRPNQWWGIDMTKVMVEDYGWVYVVIVLDWYTKKLVGYYAGLQCKSEHWREALDMAVNRQFPAGARGHDLFLMSDNGCQPTSESFMKACRMLDIKQSFTSYNNPKGNADTERMMRTIKEECLWLREWQNPFELANEFKSWAEDFNFHYLHSALSYKSPQQKETEYFNKEITLLAVA
jgi:putative transposase